jgi:hypothetical protein
MKKGTALIPFVVLLARGPMSQAQDSAPLEPIALDALGGLNESLGQLGPVGAAGSIQLDGNAELLGDPVPVEEDRARPGGKCMVEMPIRDALAVELVPSEDSRAGLVRWHPSLEAAELAAATSGRPILLFQLLGKLDDEFC